MKDAVIISTGIANIASVVAGMRRAGVEADVSSDPARVLAADYVVLPGVGAYADGMHELRRTGLDQVLRERLLADRPLLAICLGMQMLFEGSDEAPDVEGLGLLAGRSRQFSAAVPVPHLGWNDVVATSVGSILVSGCAYFANSFRVIDPPADWDSAVAEYDGCFVAGVERGGVVACQFHPELSGNFGQGIFERWFAGKEAVTC